MTLNELSKAAMLLTGNQVGVLMQLLIMEDEDVDHIELSVPELVGKLQSDTATVRRALRDLTAEGYIYIPGKIARNGDCRVVLSQLISKGAA